jgi:hypothetical protein
MRTATPTHTSSTANSDGRTRRDRVVCEFTETGTFTEPYSILPGLVLPPTGESFTDYDCDCFEVKDGLITEIRAYVTNDIDRKFSFVAKIEEFFAAGSEPASH